MNIVSRQPYLQDIEPEFQPLVREAMELLEVVRAVQNIGFRPIGVDELSARQFNLVNYFGAHLNSLKSKMK